MEKRLIINADDFGMCHATNTAIITLLEQGVITSASLMMNCPWMLEAVEWTRNNSSADVGIHITHTSEWDVYKWRPILSHMGTLMDDKGYFQPDTGTVLAGADRKQLYAEAVAQIELAYKLGIDPTNIDNHMFSMAHAHDLLLDVCERYQLPLRYPKANQLGLEPTIHEEIIQTAADRGIELIDQLAMLLILKPEPEYQDFKEAAMQMIKTLKPGVTELVLHPSLNTEEMKAITSSGQIRMYEYQVLQDTDVQSLLKSEGIRLTSWRELRDKQRKCSNKAENM
jgi:predicted glycoside hydrolase/deacetylase ChbG (UPF0249 family)